MIFPLIRPFIHAIDPERAHRLSIEGLKLAPLPPLGSSDSSLSIEVAGLRFPNPVGVAAGYDKDAEVPDALMRLGFGFVEVGSITPQPQAGNPKPRLFRLVRDRAVINRMGFNNAGAEVAEARLAKRKRSGVLGINIGANKDSVDRVADYAEMARRMAPFASYLTANISSPNTPGLRALQDPAALAGLLDAVLDARPKDGPPLFLKVAPDLEPADIDAIARLAIDKGLGALIVANTTIARPQLQSREKDEAGGLSGAPLKPLALQRLRDFRQATGGALPLIGVGGIASVDDAWERIRAGASLVQLYSAMVYEGPGLGRTIARGLARKLREHGMASIEQAVGSE
ncbi:quinone-dependent dihydroorotate dehydrogenase [Qipengyuania sp. CAU 1752]